MGLKLSPACTPLVLFIPNCLSHSLTLFSLLLFSSSNCSSSSSPPPSSAFIFRLFLDSSISFSLHTFSSISFSLHTFCPISFSLNTFWAESSGLFKMKKVILQLDLHDDKDKQKAMKKLSGISGIDSITVDMKDKQFTLIGEVDPVNVVSKLRKMWHVDIVSVGPAKEPEKKKEEPKKDEPKNDEAKKDDAKKDDKKEDPNKQVADLVKAYQAYNPHYTTHYYVQSAEENPNACVIC